MVWPNGRAVGLGVRACRATPEPVYRGLAIPHDADDERGDLHRQEQDLPGEAYGFVEQRGLRKRGTRPRRRRAGEEGERFAPSTADDPLAPEPLRDLPAALTGVSGKASRIPSANTSSNSPGSR